jgi:DDE superfamily endonuclease
VTWTYTTSGDVTLLFCGQTRPGAIHDLSQIRQVGLVEPLALIPGVTLLADADYQGLSTQTAGAVITPRPARRRKQIPVPASAAAHEAERRAHASQRIRVEHGISYLKNRRALSRHLGRRERFDTMLPAVAGLVFGRRGLTADGVLMAAWPERVRP